MHSAATLQKQVTPGSSRSREAPQYSRAMSCMYNAVSAGKILRQALRPSSNPAPAQQ